MAGRTPHEAVENFRQPLQQALSCVTLAVISTGRSRSPSDEHSLTINNGDPTPLRGESRLSLSITQHYRIVEFVGPRGPWKVSTTGYLYALHDANGHEIIAYHWHPASRVTYPHLHIRTGALVGRPELQRAHLPTGRIELEEFLRLAITDFNVQPLRDDWDEVLTRTQEVFEEWP